MVAVVVAGSPPLSAFLRQSPGKGNNKHKETPPSGLGAKENVLRVIRRDLQYLHARLRPLSKALDDLFWLRNLEDRRAGARVAPVPWPQISPYPPGLSSVELMMADFEALKAYAYYLRHTVQVWTMPLPEHYDPEAVALYFSCRPHVLAFRIIQVLLSFSSASIKMQTSRSVRLSKYDNKMNDSFDSSKYQIGQIVKESLLKLGPTFIKVGQSLSTRPDVIGPEISKALSDLHDKVPPFPRAMAMKIIEEELECPVESVFGYISEEPIAAASFGQVYYGQTIDGTSVAIKIQRPNLLHTVVRDIHILRLGLALLRRVAKRKNDISLYADELGKGLVDELDYTIEAANASDFLEAHSKYSFIAVPKVIRKLTRKRVLTMEWMPGQNPNNLILMSKGFSQKDNQYTERQKLEAKMHLLDLVNKGVEATLVQLLETGLLHADPHPGNLRYTPEGCIGFVDFGLLCRMEKKHQLAMLASIVHIVNGDWKELVYDLTEMDVVTPGTNLRNVTMDLEDALGEVVFINGFPDIKFSKVLGKIWSVALKYHFRMPPYFTLVLRSLASFEGLAIAADPNFKTFQSAFPFVVNKLLLDNSAATRRILYSVVFNKRRELQWQKILLFLRLRSMSKRRKNSNVSRILGSTCSIIYKQEESKETFETTSLSLLKLLTSNDGTVLRRLLMTADGNALARVLVSRDSAFLHQKMSMVLADIIFQWLLKVIIRNNSSAAYDYLSDAKSFAVYQTVLQDRRLKVIFYKAWNEIRRDSLLMLRLCWSAFIVLVRAAALAIHRLFVFWSEAYLSNTICAKEDCSQHAVKSTGKSSELLTM